MQGGAIGVGVAGEVANLFMCWWDECLLELAANHGVVLQLYARYVDDINTVVVKDNDDATGRSIMQKVMELANKIHPSIQVTIDFASNHPNQRMPVLDLEQWIEPVLIDGNMTHHILHSHYMKPMSSRYTTHADSALSDTTKKNILVTDLVRIMRNVSPWCCVEERKNHVQYFIHRMQFSGYSHEIRTGVYRDAKRRYERIVSASEDGTCPMYRSKFWKQEERRKERYLVRRNVDTVILLKIPRTTG